MSDDRTPCPMSEQTVGWALHALEPDEERDVIDHLAGCAECRRIAQDVGEVTEVLATALPQPEPRPELRAAIVEQARHTPQDGHADDAGPAPRLRSLPTGSDERPPPRREPAARARPGPTRRVGRVLLAAAAALVVVVGGGIVVGEMQNLRAERDASLAQARQMEDVLVAIARPGTQHAFLAPEQGATPVAAVIVQGARPEIVPMGLTPNRADDQTYVLWGLNGDGGPTAVGTFDVRPGSGGPVSVASSGNGTYGMYAVSLERGRHAPPAPSAVVAVGQVET